MKILFYSTNSNFFNVDELECKTLPTYKQSWDSLAKTFPEHQFFVVSQLPADFLIDLDGNKIKEKSDFVQYSLSTAKNAQDFADEILAIRPDIAIAATFWVTPYDWLPINDSMVAQILTKNGIKTIAHPAKTAMLCFDKNSTQTFLQNEGFNVPKAVYVHHELFWCERGRKEISTNVYKEFVFNKIKDLKFPVIAKDTVGLSSYSMEVLPTFNSVKDYLLSKKNSSDRIIQEYIQGDQFGLEICGKPSAYSVLPPFMFSVNKFGITSPKQSVKIGPVIHKAGCAKVFELEQLEQTMLGLAEKLQLCGIAQVDLVFSQNKWYILEINPRLSGMSELYSESLGQSLYQRLIQIALDKNQIHKELNAVCNFKLPILDDKQFELLHNIPFIKRIRQIHNKAAKQEREQGYCEIIFTAPNIPALMHNLETLNQEFPHLIEPVFLQNARNMVGRI